MLRLFAAEQSLTTGGTNHIFYLKTKLTAINTDILQIQKAHNKANTEKNNINIQSFRMYRGTGCV